MTKTLVETFEYVLGHRHERDNMFADIYHRLFIKLLPKEECEELLKVWLEEYEKGNNDWFAEFHKSIRQTDFYGNSGSYYYEYSPLDRISDEEMIERKELKKFFLSFKKENKDNKDFSVLYPEKAKQLSFLNEKFYKKETNSISGHLDMILHSMIYSDNNFLYKAMMETFEDYRTYERKKELGII